MRASPRTLALLLSTSLVLVSGCSKNPDDAPAPTAAQEEAATAGSSAVDAKTSADRMDPVAVPVPAPATGEKAPGISSEVAPGVAFAYRYAFTLPAKAISDTQRQHSDACAKLGPSRCRVTGMNYEQPGCLRPSRPGRRRRCRTAGRYQARVGNRGWH